MGSSSIFRFFEYDKCSTCRKAQKFLDEQGVRYEKIPIVETPPSLKDLKKMLVFLTAQGKSFKSLFNTSGLQYRELKIADQLKDGMTEAQSLELLSRNGKLIKRPFFLSEEIGLVGFDERSWKEIISQKKK